MPPHLKRRTDRGGVWYLVDGPTIKSLKTTTKRLAEARLDQYCKGVFGISPGPTVREYYLQWIGRKEQEQRRELIRKSALRDYRQGFIRYILPEFGDMSLRSISLSTLQNLRDSMLKSDDATPTKPPLALKTVRNVIDGSFRAMWRDAMREELVEKNPFQLLEWPRTQPAPPDPFTAEDRDRLLAYIKEHHTFFYPWVYAQFATGMRPSESTALRLRDVDIETGTVSISKSRHLKTDALPKTRASRRLISIPGEVVELIQAIRLPWETEESPVFYNQLGRPITANEWAGKFWKRICNKAGVKHRKFYCTRHTFITEAVRRGENIKAVADYCGTSIDMIQRDYCGRLELNHGSNDNSVNLPALRQTLDNRMRDSDHLRGVQRQGAHGRPGLIMPAMLADDSTDGADQTEIEPSTEKAKRGIVVPTGVEPVYATTDNVRDLITSRFFDKLKPRKFG